MSTTLINLISLITPRFSTQKFAADILRQLTKWVLGCLIVNTATATKFQCVEEWSDEFLALFPHRYDYIWADHQEPGAKVEWKTESRHPLSDRLIRQSTYLYGVRFGAETQYCLLDIDVASPYHPKQDPFAISRIVAALEPIGLVRHLACTSSYSGGLHLYFPFTKAQSSWQLAIALATLLESAGFKLIPGQLEIFPNPKPYSTDGTLSLFNAHRLPMQAGFYLLNDDFQPIWSTQPCFVRQWAFVQNYNDLDIQTLKRILKQKRRKHFCVSGKADKFINDLNAEIELGWTAHGQTNRLLGRITMREYIFHHVLSGGEPLQGQALVDEIISTARALPGYQEWCQHQHEIEKRAEEWARCIENSHYFHYGDLNGKFKSKSSNPELNEAVEKAPTWNQQQSEAARDRIRKAIADLLEKNVLPAKATARFQALLQYGIGGSSLYRHRDLWHPLYLVENPPDPPIHNEDNPLDSSPTQSSGQSPASLFLSNGGNHQHNGGSSNSITQSSETSGSNFKTRQDSKAISTTGSQHVQQVLFDIKAWIEVNREAALTAKEQEQRIKHEASQVSQIARMQQFLASGDPILMAEASAWAQINPGVLNIEQINIPSSIGSGTKDRGNPIIIDFSDVLAQISIRTQQLGWTKLQVNDRLFNRFGKQSQAMLTDQELWQWLELLNTELTNTDSIHDMVKQNDFAQNIG